MMNSRHQASSGSSGVAAAGSSRGLSSERKFSSVATPDMATTRRQSERIVRSGGVPGGGTVAAVTDWLGRTVTTPAAHQLSHLVQQQQKKLVLTLTGWRRRALFGLLLTLTVIVIINLSLTLWLLRSMQFSLDGIGNMRITPNGITLNGDAMVMDSLWTSQISSKRPLVVESSYNITLTARDTQGRLANRLVLGEDRLDVVARDFRVTDSRGDLLFAANRKEVTIGADLLRVSGVGGAKFEGSIQTPLVRAEPGNDLKLESSTRSIQMQAPQGVALESQAGDISATCFANLLLRSTGGSIKIDSASVLLPNIRTAPVASRLSQQQQPQRSTFQVFQVCVCSNGRLFLSLPGGTCAADGLICA